MTSDDALAAYEAARHRLPAVEPTAPPARHATSLLDLADDYDAFFLDAFGVLNVGDEAIAGVPDRVAALQEAGKRVIVVSNAAGLPHATLMEKYASLGYAFDSDDVVTSRKALYAGVGDGDGLTWGLMISDGVPAAEFEALTHVRLGDDPADYAAADAFLMIGSATWTTARQALLEAALAERPRPVHVGNPDIVAPRVTGFSVEPGFYAHTLADRTGIAPDFFGKPFHNIYDLAFARLDPAHPKDRIVMVGDSLHTDVLGAKVAGIASALVTDHGFLNGRDVAADLAATRLHPTVLLGTP